MKEYFFQKVLQRDISHWSQKTLKVLSDLNIGWHKKVKTTLQKLDLDESFEQIKNTRPNDWNRKVKQAVEGYNKERLIENCHKTCEGKKTIKTKTANVVESLNSATYERKPEAEVLSLTKKETKTLIIARYGMLECGRNFQGTSSKECTSCKIPDDEEHRLNICPKYAHINHCNSSDKVPFDSIYSHDPCVLQTIIERISSVWNVKVGHGTMNP